MPLYIRHQGRAFGWRRDIPSHQDHTLRTPERTGGRLLHALTQKGRFKLAMEADQGPPLPPAVDLQPYDTPVTDQGPLGSCTANMADNLVKFCENIAHAQFIPTSRLFTYYTTRHFLEHVSGDAGATIRATLGALALYGTPPEAEWPYDIAQYETVPDAHLYALAQNYKGLAYCRLDIGGSSEQIAQDFASAKALLATKVPFGFGFPVCAGVMAQASKSAEGWFPALGPGSKDYVVGGHAVMAVGYDDNKEIANTDDGSSTIGAVKIKNSWGVGWGKDGYGWIPYQYFLQPGATDWWVLTSTGYVTDWNFSTPW